MPKQKASQPHLIHEERTEYKVTPEEQARKEVYRQRLKEFLEDPASRQIEGFPIGENEDILALSDPPYYTACPNPFLAEIIQQWITEREANRKSSALAPDASTGVENRKYHREPFAADVSEGKNDPIYNAHSYHTKVPHKAIMRYILHYTEPGDIVFDGFCGTGMTGVAAQLCGDKKTVESLGYRVTDDGEIYDTNKFISHLGARKAVLNDLSPAATFIAYNYNTPVDAAAFEREAKRILEEVEEEYGWMYETIHTDGKTAGRINYTIWSDVYSCPHCGQEMIFWDVAVKVESGTMLDAWSCPSCGTTVAKTPKKGSGASRAERSKETVYDRFLDQIIQRAKQTPVLINYSINKKRYEKRPDKSDFALIEKIENTKIDGEFPLSKLPPGFNTQQPIDSHGITHVHHFYTGRNLLILTTIHEQISKLATSQEVKNRLKFLLSSYNLTHSTRMTRMIFKTGGKKPLLTGHQTGTLYASSLPVEKNIIRGVREKIEMMTSAAKSISQNHIATTTQSSSSTSKTPENILDYIFVDPPFGGNLMYSELNLIEQCA